MDEFAVILSSLEELRFMFISIIDLPMEAKTKMAILRAIDGWSQHIDSAEEYVSRADKATDRILRKLNSTGLDL